MILPDRVLGRPGANWIMSGVAIGPISLRTCATRSFRSSSPPALARHQGHVAVDPLPLDVVRIADDRRLRHFGMGDQRAFYFRRAEAVPGNIEHVINATR